MSTRGLIERYNDHGACTPRRRSTNAAGALRERSARD